VDARFHLLLSLAILLTNALPITAGTIGRAPAWLSLYPPRGKRLEIVPRATHLFPERGALEQVAQLARDWFGEHPAIS
jgi:hypothetical protein